jgi:hypothetical protein
MSAANHQVQVSWAPPTSNGGSPVTGYRIRIWAYGNVLKLVTVAASERSATISNLPDDIDIRVDVHTVTSAGESPRAVLSGHIKDTQVSASSIGVSGVLYPVRDGYGDSVLLAIRLSERADVVLVIKSSSGTTWLTKAFSYATGDQAVAWTGRNGPKVAAPGSYEARWSIVDLRGNRRTIIQPITVSSKRIVSTTISRAYAPQNGAGNCVEWNAAAGYAAGHWDCQPTARGAYRLDVDAGYRQYWAYQMSASTSGFREITDVKIRVCGTVTAGDAGDIYMWANDDYGFRTWDRQSGENSTCRDVVVPDPTSVSIYPTVTLKIQVDGYSDPLVWTITSITVMVTGTVLK